MGWFAAFGFQISRIIFLEDNRPTHWAIRNLLSFCPQSQGTIWSLYFILLFLLSTKSHLKRPNSSNKNLIKRTIVETVSKRIMQINRSKIRQKKCKFKLQLESIQFKL